MIAGTCTVKFRCRVNTEADMYRPKKKKKEYIRRYGEIVDKINEKLPQWNDDWNNYYPGKMEEGGWKWNLYGQYIAALENMECMYNNLDNPESRITMACISCLGEPKLIGILDNYPDVYFETIFNVGGKTI